MDGSGPAQILQPSGGSEDAAERVPRLAGPKLADGLRDIELVVDDSGLKKSSRDQPEARHYCPEPGCKASFKRKYDIDRHYQAKHTQSKNLFCPVQGCNCSLEPDLPPAFFWSLYSLDNFRRPLKSKVLASNYDKGYVRYLLYGFHRKDKLLKHLAECHKDLEVDLSSLFEEKAACPDDPVLAETQEFFRLDTRGVVSEYGPPLGRIQRKDGSWTEWSGRGYTDVAAAGFKACVKPERSDTGNAPKVSSGTHQPSSESAGAEAQGFGSSSTLNAGDETMDLSQDLFMDLVATQPPCGSLANPSMGQLVTNDHNQGAWWSTQQLSQTALSPSYVQVNNWIPNTTDFIPAVSTAVDVPMCLPDFNFNMEFTTPVETSQPNDNTIGTSGNTFDFSNMSFGDIPVDFEMSVDGACAPGEITQTTTGYFNAGSAEAWDGFSDLGSDATMWNVNNGSQGW